MKQHEKPCAECPFSRKTPPGATGGSSPQTYIGQAWGPFFLPCHSNPGYMADKRRQDQAQCAGAAIFRANCGRSGMMPNEILHLPAGHPDVFLSPAELLAHHAQIPFEDACIYLDIICPPEMLMRIEMSSPTATIRRVK